MRVFAAALAIYAVYLPLAIFLHRDYVLPPRPAGKAIEMMLKFEPDYPDRYVARSYVFGPARFPDVSKISIYEEMTPMAREDYSFTGDGSVYVIRIRPADGSDPRTNGRQYWTVATD